MSACNEVADQNSGVRVRSVNLLLVPSADGADARYRVGCRYRRVARRFCHYPAQRRWPVSQIASNDGSASSGGGGLPRRTPCAGKSSSDRSASDLMLNFRPPEIVYAAVAAEVERVSRLTLLRCVDPPAKKSREIWSYGKSRCRPAMSGHLTAAERLEALKRLRSPQQAPGLTGVAPGTLIRHICARSRLEQAPRLLFAAQPAEASNGVWRRQSAASPVAVACSPSGISSQLELRGESPDPNDLNRDRRRLRGRPRTWAGAMLPETLPEVIA